MNDFRNRQRILEAVLFLSTTEENYVFPTIEQFVLSELVNGTIAYVRGRAGEVTYQKTGEVGVVYEDLLWKYYEREMSTPRLNEIHAPERSAQPQRNIFPGLKKIIDELVEYRWVDPGGNDKPYPQTKLYEHFKGFAGLDGICPVRNRSTFELPHGTVMHIERQVLPFLSPEWRGDIEGIAKEMRKFIDEDLKYIRKSYQW
jgi:hypothetical protein